MLRDILARISIHKNVSINRRRGRRQLYKKHETQIKNYSSNFNNLTLDMRSMTDSRSFLLSLNSLAEIRLES